MELPASSHRRLDQAKAAGLPATEGAYAPFFSPDAQWVGFFAQGKLKKTRIDGGQPISLCDAPAGRGASWGQDNIIIAALDIQTTLAQVRSEGGRPISITELGPGELSHRWPHVLPGSKAVLFTVNREYAYHEHASIALESLKDHRSRILLDHAGMYPWYLPSGHLVYTTKGVLFAVPFDLGRLEVGDKVTPLQEVGAIPRSGLLKSISRAAEPSSIGLSGRQGSGRFNGWMAREKLSPSGTNPRPI
jgi:serine/threonine-protein kinase